MFVDEALVRVPALEQDLAALLGPGWSTVVNPSPSTQRYCERMREVCFNWPGGFVAHHYTRYLGDLSGGQFLARAIERHLGLDTRTGTAFYDFSAVGDLHAFKAAYRERLDAAPWSATSRLASLPRPPWRTTSIPRSSSSSASHSGTAPPPDPLC